MFENERSTVDSLLQSDQAFRRLYDKHADLNSRVDEVAAGDLSMAEEELESLKKEKLILADRMQDMIREFRANH